MSITAKLYWQNVREYISFFDWVSLVHKRLNHVGQTKDKYRKYDETELDGLAREVIAKCVGNKRDYGFVKSRFDGMTTISMAWNSSGKHFLAYDEFCMTVRESLDPVRFCNDKAYYDTGEMGELIGRLRDGSDGGSRRKVGELISCDRCGKMSRGNGCRDWLCGDCWTHEFAHRPQGVHCENFGEYIGWRKSNNFEELSDEDKANQWRKAASEDDARLLRL